MEPRIQYAHAADGISIAWWVLGRGPVLVASGLPGSHVGLEWQTPAWRTLYEQVAQRWRFVRFDHRGCGLSQREVDDFSIVTLVRDLEAVVERIEAPRIGLMALGLAGTVALAYAARHPDRVSHLVVVDATDRGVQAPPMLSQLADLAETDWEFVAQAMMRVFVGWSDEHAAREAGSFFARAIRPRELVAMTDAAAGWDVRDVLPRIAARTLVMHHTRHPLYVADSASRLAASIPGAEIALVDGPLRPFIDAETVQIVERFLLDLPPEAAALPAASRSQRARTAAVLFADIADSTRHTERLGDERFLGLASVLHARLRDIARRHRGRPMEGKLLGDGVVVVFDAAREAIAAALDCAAAGATGGLPLHVGVHAGDVLETDDNVHGGAVNIAARIAAVAPPGEVWVSDVVRSLARTSSAARFDDCGTHALKGIAEAQRIFRVTALAAPT